MTYNPYNPKNKVFTISDIQNILSKHRVTIKAQNQNIYQTAMIHSSYVERAEYISPTGELVELVPKPENCLELFEKSYEQLEHLGDSILGAAVSSYLFKRFPSENEGFLTDIKKEIVCNEMLGYISQKIGLDKFYIISKHNEEVCEGRSNKKKLGDILEAFIGAFWVDSSYNFSEIYKFVVALIETYMNIPKILLNNHNYKELLQREYQSKFHYTPVYKILSSDTNMYTMAVVDKDGKYSGIATAPTKKKAEQLAAKQALDGSRNSPNK